MNEQPELTKAHCNRCSGTCSHFILFDHKEDWREDVSGDPRDDIVGSDLYELLKCAGCGHVVFRHTAAHSQDYDDNGNLKDTVTYSPPKQNRRKPSLFSIVAGDIQCVWKGVITDLLDEIYISLHSECPRLASMGMRALLEHIVIDKIGDEGSFRKNVDKFQNAGFISSSERTLIDTTLEVGHASIHRNHKPEMDVLISCLDILEALINRIYLWPLQADAIKKTIPNRQSSSRE